MNTHLDVKDIRCFYNSDQDSAVVDGVNFSVGNGDICCLLGPSGCGKTTVLRSIAGFHKLSGGQIELDQQVISTPSHSVAPEHRHIGMVFQDYALFPHLTVAENICFGLHKYSRAEKLRAVTELLELVSLTGLEQRYPHELSGGQQQRIALARALAPKPKLLLMDEPFSSLDVELRRGLALEVRSILKQQGVSAILVTHDQEEAFAFADYIGVMNQGKVEQWDKPYELYHQAKTRFVANFIGRGAFVPGTIKQHDSINTELGPVPSRNGWVEGAQVEVLLRPDDIVFDQNSRYKGTVVHKVFAGTATLYTLQLPTGSQVEAAFASHHNYSIGEQLGIRVDADHTIAFSI